jgi:hypothetical protein
VEGGKGEVTVMSTAVTATVSHSHLLPLPFIIRVIVVCVVVSLAIYMVRLSIIELSGGAVCCNSYKKEQYFGAPQEQVTVAKLRSERMAGNGTNLATEQVVERMLGTAWQPGSLFRFVQSIRPVKVRSFLLIPWNSTMYVDYVKVTKIV